MEKRNLLLDKTFKDFNVLIDEFDYEKNSVEQTKYFIKYLLIEFYYIATRSDFSVKERIKKIKKESKNEC